ncbi:unnamed protein product [Diamesa hyperborea]
MDNVSDIKVGPLPADSPYIKPFRLDFKQNENSRNWVTVSPHFNSTLYLDIPAMIHYVDWLTIAAFDQQLPERNKKEADFAAPLYKLSERNL